MAKSAAEIVALIEDLRSTLISIIDDAELARSIRSILIPHAVATSEHQITVDLDKPLGEILDGIKRIVIERALRQHRAGSYRHGVDPILTRRRTKTREGMRVDACQAA